jgi:hypothetical protein
MSPRQVPSSTSSSRPSSGQRRRVFFAALGAASLLAVAASIGGCPIYAADSCEADPNCTSTQTYPTYDTGTPSECGTCLPGYVCSGSTGRFQCVASDCRAPEKACTGGLACTDIGGVYACRSRTDAGTDASDGAPPVIDCKSTGCISGLTCVDDGAGGHVCASTDKNACTADTDCPPKTGDGSLCLGGICKAPKDLCTDSLQCDAGKSCLDGRCVAKCTSSTCSSGYACDAKSGLCVGGAGSCPAKPPPAPTGDAGVDASSDASTDASTDETSGSDAGSDTAPSADSGTTDASGGDAAVPARVCASTAACVATHCVDKCATDGSCKSGLVCVGGGCVPDDRPIFFCDKDGTKDGTQDLCAAGSICLHHNCYVACAGPGDTSCAKFDKFPVCKTVTTSSGDHSVCGSATSLGSECDLTTSPPKTCATGKVCLDGFCK